MRLRSPCEGTSKLATAAKMGHTGGKKPNEVRTGFRKPLQSVFWSTRIYVTQLCFHCFDIFLGAFALSRNNRGDESIISAGDAPPSSTLSPLNKFTTQVDESWKHARVGKDFLKGLSISLNWSNRVVSYKSYLNLGVLRYQTYCRKR